MRNLLEHPITTAEIVDVLLNYMAEETAKDTEDGPVGSVTGLVLQETVRRIKSIADWYVERQDDHGNVAMVRSGMSEHDARALYDLFVARGHHQDYTLGQEKQQHKVAV